MADQNSQYMAMLTAVGEAKLANATALGVPWNITQLGVGDANGAEPMPSRTQTALINERRRAPLNQLSIDQNNPAIIIAEQVIPEDIGGWWIREIGLYDEAGDLIAVSNCPPTFKPELAQGSGRTQVVRLNILVSSTQNIQLKIDPSVVLATRAYADSLIVGHLAAADPHPQYTTEAEVAALIAAEMNSRDSKHSVRFTTTANINLSGLTVQAGGDWPAALTAGNRVLVKNQTTANANGLYVAASGAWVRASDADASAEVTPGMLVTVEEGTTLADTVWVLTTNGPITLGTTGLTFELVASLQATQDDAETGTNNVRWTTSLRVFQAMAKFGLGALTLPLLTTAGDTNTPSGLYRVEGSASGIPIAEAGFLDVRREGAGLVSQRYFSRSSSRVFFRRANGSFGTWEEFIHTGNLGTSAEMATGTSAIKPPSIAAVMSLFSKRSFAADDFVRIPDVPGGFIIQWGRLPNVAADGVQDVTFPVAFPSVCRGMLGCLQSSVASNNPVAVYAASTSLSAAKVVRDVTTTPYATGEIFWVAFGN